MTPACCAGSLLTRLTPERGSPLVMLARTKRRSRRPRRGPNKKALLLSVEHVHQRRCQALWIGRWRVMVLRVTLCYSSATQRRFGGKTMAETLTGGCLCGRVRYEVTAEPAFSCLCHCRSCQRYTGSAFETVIAFPSEAVNVTGELKTFDDVGDSGQPVHRRFCPNCGSGVIAECDVLPGLIIVLAGGLDDPAAFKPTMDVYWSRAHPWFHNGSARQQFPMMPDL